VKGILYLTVFLVLMLMVRGVIVSIGPSFSTGNNATLTFAVAHTFTSIAHNGDTDIAEDHWSFEDYDVSIYCNNPLYHGLNVSLILLNTGLVNMTITPEDYCDELNFSMDGFTALKTVSVYIDSTLNDTTTTNISGYLKYAFDGNITTSTNIALNAPFECSSVAYDMWNGSSYVTGENLTFPFYCFPLHENCTPYGQNTTHYTANYTNSVGTLQYLYLSINESTEGYYLKATNSSLVGNAINISTTRTKICDIAIGLNQGIWYWIDTFYPFEDFTGHHILERCS